MSRAKARRIEAGMTQVAAAVLAGVSPNTWRVYETSRAGVSEPKRNACDKAVEKIEELLRQRSAA